MTTEKGADQPPAPRFSVRVTVVVLALMIIAPLLISGAVNLYQFRQAYRSKVSSELSVMIERHSLTVDSFIDDRLSDVRVIAREHPIERLRQPDFLRRVLNLMREEYHGAFVDLGLVNSDGIQVAYAGPFNLQMADYSAAPWFHKAMASENFVSDVFAGLRGSPHFIVATQRKVGDEIFVVKATIDFEAFNALVENLRIGSTGFAFISQQGRRFPNQSALRGGAQPVAVRGPPGRPDSIRPDHRTRGRGCLPSQLDLRHRTAQTGRCGSCVISKRLRTPSPSFDTSRSLRSS